MWGFQVADNFTYDPTRPDRDKYRVEGTLNPAIEILDLRKDSPPSIQKWLTTEGYTIPFRPSEATYLWVADEQWIGPVSLVELPGRKNFWILKDSTQNLSCFKPTPINTIIKVSVNGISRLFSTSSRTGDKIGLVDWSPDSTLLEHALSDLRRISPDSYKALALTTKGVEALVTALETGGHVKTDPFLVRQRVGRAQEIAARLNDTFDVLAGLESHLLNVPAIRAVIDKASDAARVQAVEKLEAEMTKERAALAAMRQEHESLVDQIAQQREEIKRQEEEIVQQVASVDHTLQERLTAVLSAPQEFLAELALLRAGFSALPAMGHSSSSGTPPQEATMTSVGQNIVLPWPQAEGSVKALQEAKTLRGALRDRARPLGLTRYIDTLHASFMAGGMPILEGSGSLDLIEAYAGAVAGGRLLWLPVSPRIVDAMDLIGHVSPASASFIPAAGGLADVLVDALQSDELCVVVLDGMNRASMDSYVMPLLAGYGVDLAKRGSRRLSVAHPGTISSSDPYYPLTSFTWPSNVLLAGILNQGITTLPTPPNLWQHATLHVISQSDKPSLAEGTSAYTKVTSTFWNQLRQDARGIDCSRLRDILTDLQDQEPILINRGLAERFYAAKMVVTDDHNRALGETLAHCILPAAVANATDETLLEAIKTFDDASAILATHQQICRALR
jgi:hypothetical protein